MRLGICTLGFMGLFPINPFISRAVWASTILDILDKPESDPALFLSCMRAYGTCDTTFGHFYILWRYGSFDHLGASL